MNLRKIVAIALGIIWLFLVIFNYYIVHKPFSIENALAILNALTDVVAAGALYALAAAIGRRGLRAFVFASPIQAVAFQTVLGLGLISFATLALGLAGLLNPLLFWVLLLAAIFLLRHDLVSIWRDLRSIRFPATTRFERALLLFCGFALALAFLSALTPPISWDTQTYHLVIPKTAIAQGRITAPPDNAYFSFPSLVEMLYLAALLLKGDIVPQLIHLGFFVLLLLILFDLAIRYFNSRVAVLACAILLAVPSILINASWAYVDLALMCYTFAAFAALLMAREKMDWRWFALSGALAGLAMGVKYTAAIVPIALFILLLLSNESRRAQFIISHLSLVILFAAPWYLRNWIFTGNPSYPFFFGGKYWDAFRAEWFSRFGTGLANAPVQLLTAPWDATVSSSEGALGYEATLGPLLLMFLPLLILGAFFLARNSETKRQNRILHDVLIFSAILYLFWLSGVAESKLLLQSRLLFPAFPMFALGAALAIDRLDSFNLPHFSLQRFASLVIAIVLALTLFGEVLAFAGNGPLPYLVGAESRSQFIDSNLGGYAQAFNFINERLPVNARVLELWEPRSYYIQRSTQPDAILDKLPHMVWQYGNADAIAASLRADGYTHVLLSRAGLDYFLQTGYDPITPEDVQVLQDLVARHFTQVYGKTPLQIITRDGKPAVADAADDAYAVYEILPQGR